MINEPTIKTLAVIGHPISHSASPRMHTAMIQSLSIPYRYISYDVPPDELGRFVKRVREESIDGFNVTIPLKEKIMPFLDEIDEKAVCIGAVNTVVNQDGVLKGYNTDGDGFLLSLKEESHFSVVSKSVVLIGAGGSAKSIAVSLAKQGVNALTILNRTIERAQELAHSLKEFGFISVRGASLSEDQIDVLSQADLVINTTSLGMVPHTELCPLHDFSWCHSNQLVYDIIYNPEETRFLTQAREKGCRIQNGAGMLAGQGALAFTLFTGKHADYTLMKDAI